MEIETFMDRIRSWISSFIGYIKKLKNYDLGLVLIVFAFIGIGVVMIYSSSGYIAANDPKIQNSMYFMKKQGKYAILGLFGAMFISMFDYHIYFDNLKLFNRKGVHRFNKGKTTFGKLLLKYDGVRLIFLFYILCSLLQVYVILKGKEINGAKRWIEITKSISFQPSELTKVCIIMLTAAMVAANTQRSNKFRQMFFVLFADTPLIMMVAIEDLSTAIVMAAIVFVILFVTSQKWLMYIGGGVAAVGGALAYIFLGSEDYRRTRIDIWQNIETHEKGAQLLQGLYAISSGGLFGKGMGKSIQKLGKVPEAYNDMIFSILCEEFGLIGAICVIALYVVLLWRIFYIACNAKDLLGSLICVGVMTHIGVQALINMAVVTNTIPSTGIPLPFISYGVSSLISLSIEMGLVLNVSFNRPDLEELYERKVTYIEESMEKAEQKPVYVPSESDLEEEREEQMILRQTYARDMRRTYREQLQFNDKYIEELEEMTPNEDYYTRRKKAFEAQNSRRRFENNTEIHTELLDRYGKK